MKKKRVERILEVGAKQKRAYMEKFVGKDLEIVPERCIDGLTEGYSENYIRVYVEGEIPKEPTQVCVERLFQDGVLAVVKK